MTPPSVPVDNRSDFHAVQFYEHRDFLVAEVSDYLAQGLIAGQPCVVVAREEHGAAFVSGLQQKGFDTDRLTATGRLEVMDAHDALAQFMIVNSPSPQRFNSVVGGAIARASRSNGSTSVRAYGEMVDILWAAGNTVGALRLEELWNNLAETHDFRLHCAYSMNHFIRNGAADGLRHICQSHSHIARLEPLDGLDDAQRKQELEILQERLRALEQELLAREVRERELQAAMRRLAVKPA